MLQLLVLLLLLILTKFAFLEGETGKISGYSSIDCTDAGLQYMLCLRENQVHYVHLIDNFAPCIVSAKVWNNDQCMEQYCGADQSSFHLNLFSISDEAFMLLVLLNYAARWKAELHVEHQQVSIEQTCILCC